jgi:methyl acetate hydrolase
VKIALLQIIERGIVSYDTPVEEVLLEFCDPVVITPDSDGATYKPAEKKILMKHLLNHSSGLSYGIPFFEGAHRIESIPWPYQAAAFEGDHSMAKFLSLVKVTEPHSTQGTEILF